MSGWLMLALQVPAYAIGLYIAGLVVIVPGMVIGKLMERSDVPKWQTHIAVLVLGTVVCAIAFRGSYPS